MIRADTLEHTRDCTHRIFGTRPLLPAGKVCYSWAGGVDRSIIDSQSDVKDDLWKATVSLARVFHIPDEEAISLFHEVADIDMDAAPKILNAVASFVTPYLRLGIDGRVPRITCSQPVGESSNGGMTIGCGGGVTSDVLPSAAVLQPSSTVYNLNANWRRQRRRGGAS